MAVVRRWRSNFGLSRAAAAKRLGISPRMLAYYGSGKRPVPRTVELAVQALDAGLSPVSDQVSRPGARQRWVRLVEQMRAYGHGEPVLGQIPHARDREELADVLAFIRQGPDPRLALTDPALFKTLRSACTRAQLVGLRTVTLNDRQWVRMSDVPAASPPETIAEPPLVGSRRPAA